MMDKNYGVEGETFQNAYQKIVLKDRILNEKEKEIRKNHLFEISKIKDYNLITHYEYILKLHYFNSNINVLNIYRLVTHDYEKKFEEIAYSLKSNILLSLLDINEIKQTDNSMINYFIHNYNDMKNFTYVIGNQKYPIGFQKNSNETFQIYVFKIIPNKTLLLNKKNVQDVLSSAEIPNGYDSIAIEEKLYYENVEIKGNEQEKVCYKENKNDVDRSGCNKREGDNNINNNNNNNIYNNNYYNNSGLKNNYSYIYKVRNSEQILPLYLIEFEFKCLRVDISIPVCEYCYSTKAITYCYNDKVHLCDICDIKHHEKNKILKNHKRIHISESPYQFGKCPYHINELIESVCMKCFCTLCPSCILIGTHSKCFDQDDDNNNHPIMNIKDAFILSNQRKSLSDISLQNRKTRILQLLKKKHKLLSEIYSNYSSLQKRIDMLYQYIINEIKFLKKKKINFLMSLKRAVLSELLIIEWMEAFFFHTKLSLNISNFIIYQKKHQLLMNYLINNKNNKHHHHHHLLKYIPQWLMDKISVHSNLYIFQDHFNNILNINNSDKNENNKKYRSLNNITKNKINGSHLIHQNSYTHTKKLDSIYNINNMFDNNNRNAFSLYDQANVNDNQVLNKICKMKSNHILFDNNNHDENIVYSKLVDKTKLVQNNNLQDNKNNYHTDVNRNYNKNNTTHFMNNTFYEDNYFMDELNKDNNNIISEEHGVTSDYTSIINISQDYNNSTTNILYNIFNNNNNNNSNSCNCCNSFDYSMYCTQHDTNMKTLKNTYIYKELWKNLMNYKYINVIHILKAQNKKYSFQLISSFLNISNYYKSLEDFVKHIIKHEVYTLLNKNIECHTKMKITYLLDNITTLLCINNLKLAFIIDTHITTCYSEIQQNEKQFLIDVENIKQNDLVLYKTYLQQKNNYNQRFIDKDVKNEEHVMDAQNEETIHDDQKMEINIEEKINQNEFIMQQTLNSKKVSFTESENKEKQSVIEDTKDNVHYDNTIMDEEQVKDINAVKKYDISKSIDYNNIFNNDNDICIDKLISDKEKNELATLKIIKDYVYIYLEKVINDIINISHKDLNDSIRFLFYTIHDEIDGINKQIIYEKKFSIHTLTLCLDLFINSILYPYIFYIHELNVQNKNMTENNIYQKVLIIFGQTLREISIYIFQIYNLGMYDNNLKVFVNNIKNNNMLKKRITNENMFFLDVAQKLFNWIIKNLESPRYYSPLKWYYGESIEKSYKNVVQEIINIDKSSSIKCVNENVDYNILFSTTNFKDILTLCYSINKEWKLNI
ncbi:hypothetical protein PFTANZ_05373 [Plasmodium falciparum Tanzania (2000708)]|uniref:B box-type domain-containing protein n=1 Tax=Plasmodium falciparum Tanzania (2000708) TaxID=1036725 RepID=A0A024VZ40_PLAFA|nr:hypothetical protein PFTANZ_05373 [Plasmodium falciparum Tanzania (2000708)]